MATRKEIISDVELRLTEGKPSDDFELDHEQISHWVDVVRDELVTARLQSLRNNKKPIPKIYVEAEECKVIVNADQNCRDEERYYVTLSNTPLELENDEAMVLVTNQGGKEIHPIDHEHSDYINYLQFSKPSVDNPIYYREGNRLYLQKFSALTRLNVNVIVYYARALQGAGFSSTVEYLIEPGLVDTLTDLVEEKAERQMLGRDVADYENDGVDDNG